MGSLYRSEKMSKCQIFLPVDAAYACVAEMGELGLAQFRDLNPEVNAFQRKFVNEVRRCDEMERKLRYFDKEIRKEGISIPEFEKQPDAPKPGEMVDLEAKFEQLESELREINVNDEKLTKSYLELTELRHVLGKTQSFFEDHSDIHALHSFKEDRKISQAVGYVNPALMGSEGDLVMRPEPREETKLDLSFVTGVINRKREPAFERLLWRACRGNVFTKKEEIPEPLLDPSTGDFVNKTVFVIFFQGEQLKIRVKKICEAFRASLYPCPERPQERREMQIGVMSRLEDIKVVMAQTTDHRVRDLTKIARQLEGWFIKVRKMKAIYHTLNMFNMDVTMKCLIAESWCPSNDLDKIQLALKRGSDESGSGIPAIINKMETDEEPPTYFKTNKFTKGFQNIVDAYGMANYRECNPAPYTIISFPFLFAVMFGDAGHGVLMFLAAMAFVVFERQLEAKKIRDEIFSTFYGGRYIILLMGLFSIYTGSIYNDIYAKSFAVFPVTWKMSVENTTLYSFIKSEGSLTLDPKYAFNNLSYIYGFDPIWNIADNKLSFINSFKMKMSVIIGVFQMLFGVCLSFMNYSKIDMFCMFVPQILFLGAIFVYLCVIIFVKWTHFSVFAEATSVGYYAGSHCAPSLLIGLINMFMFKSRETGFTNCTTGYEPYTCTEYNDCYLQLWYKGQTVHADLSAEDVEVLHEKAAGHGDSGKGHSGHAEEFEFSEALIHQAIHTIEFCLGCVSHTASYLRLWALSLAHAELSDVLWTMIFRMGTSMGLNYVGGVLIYFIFWAFATLSVAVLIMMEGLSAFLHALRLHWVEFQSKFYSGGGYAFTPFCFDTILEETAGLE